MNATKGSILVPLLIITLGVAWLLTVQGVGRDIDWVWTLGLALVGIVILVLAGIDKMSVVVGPFFLLASVFSVLRQTRVMVLETEVPLLVIALGALMLIARHPAIPPPPWVREQEKQTPREDRPPE